LPCGLELRGDGEPLCVRDGGETISDSLIGMNFSMTPGVPFEIARLTIESRVALFKRLMNYIYTWSALPHCIRLSANIALPY
jgi:hypothetical protein